jgi:hypothetical protein
LCITYNTNNNNKKNGGRLEVIEGMPNFALLVVKLVVGQWFFRGTSVSSTK